MLRHMAHFACGPGAAGPAGGGRWVPGQEEAVSCPGLVPAGSSQFQDPQGQLGPLGSTGGREGATGGEWQPRGRGETGEAGGGGAGDMAGGMRFYGTRCWGQALSSHLLASH